jgi:hypothetical protein
MFWREARSAHNPPKPGPKNQCGFREFVADAAVRTNLRNSLIHDPAKCDWFAVKIMRQLLTHARDRSVYASCARAAAASKPVPTFAGGA